MNSKRIFSIVSFMVMVTMLLSACAAPTAPTAAPAAPAEPAAPAAPAALAAKDITIAGVVFQDDQFMNSMVQGYKDAGEKLGVKIVTANTNNDQAKETELIQTYMSQGVSGIAIAPLSKDASIATLKEADAKGIKVAITNMSISDSSFLAGGFTSDDRTNSSIVGKEAAKFIKEKLTGKISVAVIDFDDQLPEQSKARWGGFLDTLKAEGVDYDLVAHQSAHLQDTALAAATDMLTANPGIQVIWASNEGGTIGAAMAVKQAGLAGKVFVYGYDGSDQLTSLILDPDNILQGAVAQDPYNMGYKAVEALVGVLEGKPGPDAGKMTVVNGTYLGRSDMAAVNTWRKANGLKEIAIEAAPAAAAKAEGPAAPKAPMAAADITIAGVVFQDDQFMNTLVQGYTDAAAKMGVKIVTANTNNDQTKETELIQTYMSQGVSGIAIAPLSKDASIATLKEANAAGIPVAITNMGISDSSFLVGGYTSDDRTNSSIVGKEAAKFIKEKLTGKIKVGVIDFDDQLPEQSKARWGGFLDTLKAEGIDYELAAHQSAHLQDTALAAATDMLTANPDIQIIWASNEGGTIGAAMAVKQAGMAGKVFVFGYDGSDQLTSLILDKDNILQGTVAQDPYNMGYQSVTALVNFLMGEGGEDTGKIVVVNGTYLGRSDPEAVKAWRKANGLK
jgi:ABC-type sugar transport system substrate-binding protein